MGDEESSETSAGEIHFGGEEMNRPSTESPRHIINDGEGLVLRPSEDLDTVGIHNAPADVIGLHVTSEEGVEVPEDVEFTCKEELLWVSVQSS